MKKLIVLFSAIAFACSVNAQNATTPTNAAPATPAQQPRVMHRDMVMMKDGKMMMIKDGKLVAMDKEMTMSNGSKVMTDGTVMMKDGSKTTMKNGDRMDMDGRMMPMHRMMGQPNQLQQAQPAPQK